MAQKLTRPKEGKREILLNEEEGREIYKKLHKEMVEETLPELERLNRERARMAMELIRRPMLLF